MKTFTRLFVAVTFASLSFGAAALPHAGLEVAQDGADRTGIVRVAQDGADRSQSLRVAEDGSERSKQLRVAQDGSERSRTLRQG